MYCICCKKNNVKPSDLGQASDEEKILWKKEYDKDDGALFSIDNEMINGGIIQIINAGYGSRHDGDQLIIAICDDCIESNLQEGNLLYWGNYMGFASDDLIERSKKLLRRNNNLDEII